MIDGSHLMSICDSSDPCLDTVFSEDSFVSQLTFLDVAMASSLQQLKCNS